MSSLFIHLVLFWYNLLLAHGQIGSEVTASATLYSSSDFTFSVGIVINLQSSTNAVSITMQGSTDNWFGIGFNSTTMSDTYAIVSSGGHSWGDEVTEEFSLGDQAYGSKLTSMLSLNQDDGSSGIRTVSVSRDRTGITPNHYTFPVTTTDVDIIWAVGPTVNFDQEAGGRMMDSGSITLSFILNGAPTPTVTEAPINTITAYKSLYSQQHFDVTVSVDILTSIVTITINGPINKWFGVGFGATAMDQTYAIIVSDSTVGVEEYILGDHASGSTVSSSQITIQSDSSTSIKRTVIITRPISTSDYTFPSTTGSIHIIYAYGTSSTYCCSMASRSTGSLTFIDGTVITTTTTEPTSQTTPPSLNPTPEIPPDNIIAYKSLYSQQQFDIAVSIDILTSIVTLTINGPINKWFGVGFGATVMDQTYAIIVSDSTEGVEEYILGNHAAGSTVTSSQITIQSDSSTSITRNVKITRPISTSDYTFPSTTGNINIIYAYGTSSTYCCSMASRSTGSLAFIAGTVITTTTFEPTSPTAPPSLNPTPETPADSIIAYKALYAEQQFDIAVTVNTLTNVVNIRMNGPLDKWFGVGFGATIMDQTYAIVVSGSSEGVEEYILGNHAAGSTVTSSTITIQSDTSTSTKRTVVITRAISTSDYTFPSSVGSINIIYAYGTSSTYCCSMFARSITSLTFVAGSEVTTTTVIPITTDTPQSDCTTNMNTLIYSQVVPSHTLPFNAKVCVFNNSKVEIEMTGPADKWFGIGFNNTIMSNTYSIVVYNTQTVSEVKLGDHTTGEILFDQMINVTKHVITDGVRNIILQRDIIGRTTDHYTFSTQPNTIWYIYGWGPSNTYSNTVGMEEGGMSDDPVQMIFVRRGTTIPTTTQLSTTQQPYTTICNGDLNTHKILSTDYDLSITVCINLTMDTLEMFIDGPDDKWFGVGFGNTVMDGTYAIIADDTTGNTVNEYLLGDHAEGTIFDTSSVSIINDTSSDGLKHIYITRDRIGMTSEYYTFPDTSTSINVIWALGTSTTYHSSGMLHRGSNTLMFTNKSTNGIITTTSLTSSISESTTKNTENGDECSGIMSYSSDCGNGFNIGFSMNCDEKTMTLSVNYTEYDENWFGIVFNDAMTPSYSAIFTTGKSDEDSAPRNGGVYAYHLKEKAYDSVIYMGDSIWEKINQTHIDSTMSYQYIANLSDTIWSTNTEEITFRYAWGSSLTLSVHNKDDTSETFIYNLKTGSVSVKSDNNSLQIAHGIIMWIAWGLCASIGIMSSKFRRIVERFISKKKGFWFKIHRIVQSSVVFLVIIGFIIAIYFTDSCCHFMNTHMQLGLVIVILGILQPINAFIRPHPAKKGENKPVNRLIWEIVHKSSGYSAWILGLVNIYFGIKLVDNVNKYKGLQIGWIVFIVIFFISLWIYDYFVLNKANKSTSNDDDKKLLNNEPKDAEYQLIDDNQL